MKRWSFHKLNDCSKNKVIMKNLIIIIVLLMISHVNLLSQEYELVWSDEFEGDTLNSSNWEYMIGDGTSYGIPGWGNNELQFYTNRDTNVFIEDGKLVIQALKESYSGKNYTSARLTTENNKSFKYGKIEARMKLPFGQGIWPAFWMLGNNISSVGWPASGEIDIMEMIGGVGNDNVIHGTVHWESGGNHAQYGGSYILQSGIFADNFNVFSIEWTPQFIKWYINGSQYHVIDITPSGLSELQQDFFILLNAAVGGNWPGSPDASTQFPQRFEIEYIRVFQINDPTSVEDDEKLINKNIYLEQNFPNPFNPTTQINYSIIKNSHISLDVYDVLGNKIKSLVNEIKTAGSHKVNFDGRSLTSGVYFYRLAANGQNLITRKMILLE